MQLLVLAVEEEEQIGRLAVGRAEGKGRTFRPRTRKEAVKR
jgi:hypothetical protein